MNLTITEADRERLATAIEFYLARCTWSSGDEEKAEFERVLGYLNGRSPRGALVESLRDNGMEAEWAGYTADAFFHFAGPDAHRMVNTMLTDDGKAALIDQMLDDRIDVGHADHLVESLASALENNAVKTQEDQA